MRRGCLHVSAPSFFSMIFRRTVKFWSFTSRLALNWRPLKIDCRCRLAAVRGCNSWRLCWISRTGVTVPENALNITERCRATAAAAAAAGHSGISYGPNWSLRCLASNGMSLISFPADHICLFLLFLLLLLWCANIPCCPWLTDRGRTTHPPQRKWGQHECVMPFFLFFLLLARCCRGYSTRVCRRRGNQISAVHKLPLIDCRWILQRSLEVNYCIMERFDIDSHPVRLVAESGIPCRWINKNRQLAPR